MSEKHSIAEKALITTEKNEHSWKCSSHYGDGIEQHCRQDCLPFNLIHTGFHTLTVIGKLMLLLNYLTVTDITDGYH
jgi:hypothetical protein